MARALEGAEEAHHGCLNIKARHTTQKMTTTIMVTGTTTTTTTTNWDTLSSTDSETSVAVVSLYESWSGASLCGPKSVGTSSTTAAGEDDQTRAIEDLRCFTVTTTTSPVAWESNHDDCWNQDSHLAHPGDDEITLPGLEDDGVVVSEDTSREDGLRQALRKRLSSELDIPQVPPLKRRRKPVCLFLNFLGKRHAKEELQPAEPSIVEDPCLWHLNLGLDETDALFPMISADPIGYRNGDDEALNDNMLATPAIIMTTKKAFAAKATGEDRKLHAVVDKASFPWDL